MRLHLLVALVVPALVPALVVPALVVAAPRAASAECHKRATGTPIYRETRGPLVESVAGAGSPVQPQTFAIHATGTWTWVGAGEVGSGEAMGRSGCIVPAALREVTRAVARARFRFETEPMATCDALPTARIVYAAPRRGKRIATEAPCGVPVDRSTRLLIACAQAVMQDAPPAGADLRAICRGAP